MRCVSCGAMQALQVLRVPLEQEEQEGQPVLLKRSQHLQHLPVLTRMRRPSPLLLAVLLASLTETPMGMGMLLVMVMPIRSVLHLALAHSPADLPPVKWRRLLRRSRCQMRPSGSLLPLSACRMG